MFFKSLFLYNFGQWLVALAAATALAVVSALSAAAQSLTSPAAGCALEDGGTASVVAVLSPSTLQLDDGRAVLLTGALSPRQRRGWSKDLKIEEQVTEALGRLALGRKVRLGYDGRRRDRYGRLLAHIFVVGEAGGKSLWLQAALIEKGLALAYASGKSLGCARALEAKESAARAAAVGFWKTGLFRIHEASDPGALSGLSQTYQIVEGVVYAVAEIRGRVYLNFDADWRRDFTASIAPRNRRVFAGLGAPDAHSEEARNDVPSDDAKGLAALKGARIRVRGWLRQRGGPMIDLRHRAQIEIVKPGAP